MLCFFIFNRALGRHSEDASLAERAESLLHYASFSAEPVELVEKVRQMELMEAFLDVAKLFGDGNDDSIHQVVIGQVHHALLEVEAGIYLCMGLNTTTSGTHDGNSSPSAADGGAETGLAMRMYRSLISSPQPPAASGGGGSPRNRSTTYKRILPPHPESLRALLREVYSYVSFLMGPFAQLDNTLGLQSALERLVPLCLQQQQQQPPSTLHCAPLRCLVGLEHLPMDRTTFLTVQSFMHLAHSQPQDWFAKQPKMLLFGGGGASQQQQQLVWSSLETSDCLQVFSFLQAVNRTQHAILMDDGYLPIAQHLYAGSEVVALASKEASRIYFPKVFIASSSRGGGGGWRRMACLKVKQAVLVLFSGDGDAAAVPEDETEIQLHMQRFKQAVMGELGGINAMLQDSLQRIAADEQQQQQPSVAFVYANKTNGVLKSSSRFQQWAVSPSSNRTSAAAAASMRPLYDSVLPKSALRAFHACWLAVYRQEPSEMCIVVCGEWCVTAWRSGGRRLFRFSSAASRPGEVAFSMLGPLDAEMDKLVQARFSNVVMF